jgi:membrane protein YdbS with pleckstrin-like domain
MAHSAPTTQVVNGTDSPQPLNRRPHIRHIHDDEEVYGLFHRHYIVFLRGLTAPVIAFLVLMLIGMAISMANPADTTGLVETVLSAGTFVVCGALVAIAVWVAYIFADWRADYMLVTPQRILVNVATPGIRTVLREVPMGKVQNTIIHHASIHEPIKKVMQVAKLVIDTAGLGQITFDDISERDADAAKTIIMGLQKNVRASSQPTREQYRHQVMSSIINGTPMPPQPRKTQVRSYPRSGYNLLNEIFPRHPQREGLKVVWHKHWWYLLQAELVPVGIFILFEITNLIVSLVSGAMGVPDNPVMTLLAFVRPIIFLLLLPIALWQWEDWRNDKYILDRDRLITVYTLPLGLDETVKETEIRRVVDATVRVEGLLPNLLRFGTVVMKTPGEATQFDFAGVPHPFEVHQEIMTRLEAQREQEQAQWDRDIQDWLRTYVEERRAEPSPHPPPPPDGWTVW